MRKLFILSFLVALFSCSEKESSEGNKKSIILEDISYSLDTVVVDPGEEIIAITNQYQLKNSTSFSEDTKFLYLLDYENITISKIDLNQLRLLEIFHFEKEGPNGTEAYVQRQQVLPEEQFLITGYQSAGVFDKNGSKLQSFKLSAKEYNELDPDIQIGNQLTYSSDSQWLFCLTGYSNQASRELVKINPKEKSGELIDLPAFDVANDFMVSLHSDQGSMFSIPQTILQEINGNLYFTNEVTSSIYKYDYQSDSLQLFTYNHQLVPSFKTGKLKGEVSSQEEFYAEMQKSSNQVSFEKLLWDEKSNRFFRLGRKVFPKEEGNFEDFTAEVYLFIYDKDLNLLGETLLKDLKKPLVFYFIKDGKLWSYVNVEDELGFAVFTFDF